MPSRTLLNGLALQRLMICLEVVWHSQNSGHTTQGDVKIQYCCNNKQTHLRFRLFLNWEHRVHYLYDTPRVFSVKCRLLCAKGRKVVSPAAIPRTYLMTQPWATSTAAELPSAFFAAIGTSSVTKRLRKRAGELNMLHVC